MPIFQLDQSRSRVSLLQHESIPIPDGIYRWSRRTGEFTEIVEGAEEPTILDAEVLVEVAGGRAREATNTNIDHNHGWLTAVNLSNAEVVCDFCGADVEVERTYFSTKSAPNRTKCANCAKNEHFSTCDTCKRAYPAQEISLKVKGSVSIESHCRHCYQAMLEQNQITPCYLCGKTPKGNCSKLPQRRSDGTPERLLCEDCTRTRQVYECVSCGNIFLDADLEEDHREIAEHAQEFVCPSCREDEEAERRRRWNAYVLPPCHTNGEFPAAIATGVELELESKGIESDIGQINYIPHTKVITDASLDDGIEIVTEPAYGKELGSLLREVCEGAKIANLEARVTCGLHVHLNARNLSEKEVKKIGVFYLLFEHAIYSMLPHSRATGQYSKKMLGHITVDDILKKPLDDSVYMGTGGTVSYSKKREMKKTKYCSVRYYGLNLHSYYYRGTVEFRHHSGTRSYTKIKHWINLLHCLYEKGLQATAEDVRKIQKMPAEKRTQYFVEHVLDTEKLRKYYKKRCKKFSHKRKEVHLIEDYAAIF